MKKQDEYALQVQVCTFLKYQYPGVRFLSDTVANLKLTIGQQLRNKKIQCPGFKCMDVLILEPVGKYCGLFIELKIETPFKKNGEIKASQDDHLKKQYESIQLMNDKGYYACFTWTLDMTIEIINKYMKNNL